MTGITIARIGELAAEQSFGAASNFELVQKRVPLDMTGSNIGPPLPFFFVSGPSVLGGSRFVAFFEEIGMVSHAYRGATA